MCGKYCMQDHCSIANKNISTWLKQKYSERCHFFKVTLRWDTFTDFPPHSPTPSRKLQWQATKGSFMLCQICILYGWGWSLQLVLCIHLICISAGFLKALSIRTYQADRRERFSGEEHMEVLYMGCGDHVVRNRLRKCKVSINVPQVKCTHYLE